jgi:hypothetical protein
VYSSAWNNENLGQQTTMQSYLLVCRHAHIQRSPGYLNIAGRTSATNAGLLTGASLFSMIQCYHILSWHLSSRYSKKEATSESNTRPSNHEGTHVSSCAGRMTTSFLLFCHAGQRCLSLKRTARSPTVCSWPPLSPLCLGGSRTLAYRPVQPRPRPDCCKGPGAVSAGASPGSPPSRGPGRSPCTVIPLQLCSTGPAALPSPLGLPEGVNNAVVARRRATSPGRGAASIIIIIVVVVVFVTRTTYALSRPRRLGFQRTIERRTGERRPRSHAGNAPS